MRRIIIVVPQMCCLVGGDERRGRLGTPTHPIFVVGMKGNSACAAKIAASVCIFSRRKSSEWRLPSTVARKRSNWNDGCLLVKAQEAAFLFHSLRASPLA